jgi:hypothetical protein
MNGLPGQSSEEEEMLGLLEFERASWRRILK